MPDGFEPPVFLRPGDAPPHSSGPYAQAWPATGGVGSPAPGPAGDGMGFPAEDEVRPWPWWVALVALAAAFLAIIAAGIAFALLGPLLGASDDLLEEADYLFGLIQDVLWVAVAIGIPLAIVHWIRPEHLGIRRRHLGFSALKLVIVLFGFYLMAAIYSAAMGLDENSNQLLKDTGFGDSLGKDLAYAILYPVAAPVAEELLFRGVLFKGLRDGLRSGLGRGAAARLIAAVISGAIFGALHLGGGQDAFIHPRADRARRAPRARLRVERHDLRADHHPRAQQRHRHGQLVRSHAGLVCTASSPPPGRVLAVLVTMLIGRLVRRLPSEPPPTLPPSIPSAPGGPPVDGPPPARPLGL